MSKHETQKAFSLRSHSILLEDYDRAHKDTQSLYIDVTVVEDDRLDIL